MHSMNIRMAHVVLIVCLAAGAAGASVSEKGPQKSDAAPAAVKEAESAGAGNAATKKIVVAKVNGVALSMHSLVQMVNRMAAKSEPASTEDRVEQIKKEALARLVLQELAWQKAQSRGLQPEPEKIDAAIDNLKTNVGGDEGFRQLLEKEQVTEQELRTQVKRSLILELIYAEEVYRKVTIPEDELRNAYEKKKEKFIKAEKISVTDVFFPGKNSDKALEKNARIIRTRILQDKNKDPWQISLDGTFDVRTYEPRKEKDGELIEEARKMKPDNVSPVIKAKDGFHIIKLREYNPGRQLSFEEVRSYLENQLRMPAQDLRLREWEQELRKDAVIEIIK